MNKIELKCGGFVYIEPFNDYEEEERCKIYDENMNYLDYYADVYELDEYNKIIDFFSNINDIHDYLEIIYRSYDYGNSIDDLIDNFLTTNYWDYSQEEMEQMTEEMKQDRETMTEHDFCAKHLINKIGNLYFVGDD